MFNLCLICLNLSNLKFFCLSILLDSLKLQKLLAILKNKQSIIFNDNKYYMGGFKPCLMD